MITKTCPKCGAKCLESATRCPGCQSDVADVPFDEIVPEEKMPEKSEAQIELESYMKAIEGFGGPGFVLIGLISLICAPFSGGNSMIPAIIFFIGAAMVYSYRKSNTARLTGLIEAVKLQAAAESQEALSAKIDASERRGESPLNTLKARLAGGVIDETEYHRLKAMIED